MDINDRFEAVMKTISQLADEVVKEQMQKKMQKTARGPETEEKKTENHQLKRKVSL